MADRWALSSKTICPVCGERIKRGRDSYCQPAPGHVPTHFRCHYPEMATTNGAEK